MISIRINGQALKVTVDPAMPLLWVLRDHLGLTGTKFGCGEGLCGACTVLLDGQAIRSCQTPIAAVGAKGITTIEGVASTSTGRAVQAAWEALDVAQCGYCQSGQILSATGLLKRNPTPNDADIDAAMSGNLCRCGTYTRIRAAIKQAAKGNAK